MLKKIFKIIITPNLIPKKIFNKILFTYNKLQYQKKNMKIINAKLLKNLN